MCALLPLSMPPGLFYPHFFLNQGIYQTTNLLSTNPLLSQTPLTNILPATGSFHRMVA